MNRKNFDAVEEVFKVFSKIIDNPNVLKDLQKEFTPIKEVRELIKKSETKVDELNQAIAEQKNVLAKIEKAQAKLDQTASILENTKKEFTKDKEASLTEIENRESAVTARENRVIADSAVVEQKLKDAAALQVELTKTLEETNKEKAEATKAKLEYQEKKNAALKAFAE